MGLLLYLQKKYNFSTYPAKLEFFDAVPEIFEKFFFRKNKNILFCVENASYPLLVLYIDALLQRAKEKNSNIFITNRLFYGAFIVAIKSIYEGVSLHVLNFFLKGWRFFHPNVPFPDNFDSLDWEFLITIQFDIPVFYPENLLLKNIELPIGQSLLSNIADSYPAIFSLAVLQLTLPYQKNILNQEELVLLLNLKNLNSLSYFFYFLSDHKGLWKNIFVKKMIFNDEVRYLIFNVHNFINAQTRGHFSTSLPSKIPDFYRRYIIFIIQIYRLSKEYPSNTFVFNHLEKLFLRFSTELYFHLFTEWSSGELVCPNSGLRSSLENYFNELRAHHNNPSIESFDPIIIKYRNQMFHLLNKLLASEPEEKNIFWNRQRLFRSAREGEQPPLALMAVSAVIEP